MCVSVPISGDQLIAVAASAFCHAREGGRDGGNEWSVRDAGIDDARERGRGEGGAAATAVIGRDFKKPTDGRVCFRRGS